MADLQNISPGETSVLRIVNCLRSLVTYVQQLTFLTLSPTLNTLTNAANDAAASVAGVPVGGLYRNGSVIQVRIA
jgi:hypothetical protein